MPTLPPKTYFPLKYDHDIEDRRQKLHVYLQQIMNRVDMRTSPIFRKFIEIDKQIPESVMYSPVKVASITDLSLGGRDFEILLQKGLLFVAMSDMKITTRLDSYITNVSAFSFHDLCVYSLLCLGIQSQQLRRFMLQSALLLATDLKRMKMKTQSGSSNTFGLKDTLYKQAVCTGLPLKMFSILASMTDQLID
jgi:hypothetical protein